MADIDTINRALEDAVEEDDEELFTPGICVVCGEEAAEVCQWCGLPLCIEHWGEGDGLCPVCYQEEQDEIENALEYDDLLGYFDDEFTDYEDASEEEGWI